MRGLRALAALLLAVGCLWLAWQPEANPAVGETERFNRDVAVASAATYVSLRVINAALSAVQEVEVGASIGVSGNFQPLKWLEPVDDTVERVSELVFAVAILNGVLSLAVGPVAAVGFVLLAIGFLGRGCCEVTPRGWHGKAPALRRGIGGCGGLGFALAVAIPLAFALGSFAGEFLTSARWETANATLEAIAERARTIIGDSTEDRGWRDTIDAYLTLGGVFWDQADALFGASLTLVGIYILRMVVLPVVLFLAFLRITRAVVQV